VRAVGGVIVGVDGGEAGFGGAGGCGAESGGGGGVGAFVFLGVAEGCH
jgi:hypothetical protein